MNTRIDWEDIGWTVVGNLNSGYAMWTVYDIVVFGPVLKYASKDRYSPDTLEHLVTSLDEARVCFKVWARFDGGYETLVEPEADGEHRVYPNNAFAMAELWNRLGENTAYWFKTQGSEPAHGMRPFWHEDVRLGS